MAGTLVLAAPRAATCVARGMDVQFEANSACKASKRAAAASLGRDTSKREKMCGRVAVEAVVLLNTPLARTHTGERAQWQRVAARRMPQS